MLHSCNGCRSPYIVNGEKTLISKAQLPRTQQDCLRQDPTAFETCRSVKHMSEVYLPSIIQRHSLKRRRDTSWASQWVLISLWTHPRDDRLGLCMRVYYLLNGDAKCFRTMEHGGTRSIGCAQNGDV